MDTNKKPIEIHIRVVHGLPDADYKRLKEIAKQAGAAEFLPPHYGKIWFTMGASMSSQDSGETVSARDIFIRVPPLGDKERPLVGMREVFAALGLADESIIQDQVYDVLRPSLKAVMFGQTSAHSYTPADVHLVTKLLTHLTAKAADLMDPVGMLAVWRKDSDIRTANIKQAASEANRLRRENEERALAACLRFEQMLLRAVAERA